MVWHNYCTSFVLSILCLFFEVQQNNPRDMMVKVCCKSCSLPAMQVICRLPLEHKINTLKSMLRRIALFGLKIGVVIIMYAWAFVEAVPFWIQEDMHEWITFHFRSDVHVIDRIDATISVPKRRSAQFLFCVHCCAATRKLA